MTLSATWSTCIPETPSGLPTRNPTDGFEHGDGLRPSVNNQSPFMPGGFSTTRGARSPYSFCASSHAAGGSFKCPSAEISLKLGIQPLQENPTILRYSIRLQRRIASSVALTFLV